MRKRKWGDKEREVMSRRIICNRMEELKEYYMKKQVENEGKRGENGNGATKKERLLAEE